MEADELHDLD